MNKNVGNKIRELRKNAGMTQSELADRLGISPSAVGMYEQGRREPDSNMLLKICSVFGTSSDYILGKAEENKAETREISDVFDEFTRILSMQQGLMFDGEPLGEADRGMIVDAIKAVAALARQQHRKPTAEE